MKYCSVTYSSDPYDVYSSMNAIDVNVSKVIETIGHCCMLHVPLKSFKSFNVTHFHRERKILMRKRRKLVKKNHT